MALLGAVLTLTSVLQLVCAGVVDIAKLNSVVKVKISDDKTHVDIYCAVFPTSNPIIDFIYPTYQITSVTFDKCPPPSESYASLLTVFGVNAKRVENITLQDIPDTPVLLARHLDSLPGVTILNVFPKAEGKQFRPEVIFLSQLQNLLELNVRNMLLPPLPLNIPVETIQLSMGSSDGEWGGCQRLRWLTVEQWDVPAQASAGWLAHCPNLVTLKLVSLTTGVIKTIVSGASHLNELLIFDSTLSHLDRDLLPPGNELSILKIVNSGLVNIANDALSPLLQLQLLDLSRNQLNVEALQALAPLPELRVLSLSNNSGLHEFCDYFNTNDNTKLSSLLLSHTGVSRLCFRPFHALMSLDLSGNHFATFQFDELPLAEDRERPLEVNLRDTNLGKLVFSQALYQKLAGRWKKTTPSDGYPKTEFVSINGALTLQCGGADSFLKRAIDEKIISANSHCIGETSEPGHTEHTMRGLPGPLPFDDYPRPDRPSHPSTGQLDDHSMPDYSPPTARLNSYDCAGCSCTGEGNDVIAWCKNGMDRMPRIDGVKELHASGNNIEVFDIDDLPETLVLLDLRHNKISRLSAVVSAMIFNVTTRKVYLEGNPIACDCDNLPLLAELKNHDDQVDFMKLTCEKTNKWVNAVQIENICHARDIQKSNNPDGAATAVASSVLLVLALLTVCLSQQCLTSFGTTVRMFKPAVSY